jgi:hypothetical protein
MPTSVPCIIMVHLQIGISDKYHLSLLHFSPSYTYLLLYLPFVPVFSMLFFLYCCDYVSMTDGYWINLLVIEGVFSLNLRWFGILALIWAWVVVWVCVLLVIFFIKSDCALADDVLLYSVLHFFQGLFRFFPFSTFPPFHCTVFWQSCLFDLQIDYLPHPSPSVLSTQIDVPKL